MSRAEDPGVRYRLPLFPLSVVLLPGAPMPLHIFEPRYRDMVTDCLDGDRRFGLVYHDPDAQGPFLCEEGRIGCVAEIDEHEPLPDGRSIIVVNGVERFRISDGIESDARYFEALVTPYGDQPGLGANALPERRRVSIQLFRQVVATLTDDPERLPELDPDDEVSFRLAQAIHVSPSWHQTLLELRDEEARLKQLDRVFRRVLD